jgi:hypothetical protein
MDLVKKIYESVVATDTKTKVEPSSNQEQTSDPYFSISFDYKDGTKETIYSTETGKFIFKRLSGTGWTGSPNNQLIGLVNEVKGQLYQPGLMTLYPEIQINVGEKNVSKIIYQDENGKKFDTPVSGISPVSR